MLKIFSRRLLLTALTLLSSSFAYADLVTLRFEGVGNNMPVGNFYNGGAGTNYGVSFGSSALALVDSDAGGTGKFANEPSPSTVLFFVSADNVVMNVAAGFDTGFSFYYSSLVSTTVNVYDGVDATGDLLASLTINQQAFGNECKGDPTNDGGPCNWTPVGASFAGIAKSVSFAGRANQTGFDNVTLGSATPFIDAVGTVPEPTPLALVALGLLCAAGSRRRPA